MLILILMMFNNVIRSHFKIIRLDLFKKKIKSWPTWKIHVIPLSKCYRRWVIERCTRNKHCNTIRTWIQGIDKAIALPFWVYSCLHNNQHFNFPHRFFSYNFFCFRFFRFFLFCFIAKAYKFSFSYKKQQKSKIKKQEWKIIIKLYDIEKVKRTAK